MKLKSCPFCGSDDIDPDYWRNDANCSGPGCNFCGSMAETTMWNKRAEEQLLYRAKEILGAHHGDLSPLEQEFFKKLEASC